MNTTIYQVIHFYGVDGGYGDAVPVEDVIATFDSEEKANEFAKKYGKDHAYDKPYATLWCGDLQVREIIIDNGESFNPDDESEAWWLHNRVL